MRRLLLALALPAVVLATLAAGCGTSTGPAGPDPGFAIDPARADTVVLAGGCFWCMEKPFEALDGVASVTSGFSGGTVPNPTYDQVSTKTTGHYEVVEVVYDPDVVAFETLIQLYWHTIDPIDDGGQFCDRGGPYRPAIFVSTPEERAAAQATKDRLDGRFVAPVAVPILDRAPFYAAEAYHQDFYRTNAAHYARYRAGCGRDARLRELWGDNADVVGDGL